MKKFLGPLLTTGTLLALLYTVYGYREQNEKLKKQVTFVSDSVLTHNIDSLTKVVDSLETEVFSANNAAGRYELSLQHLEEVNPKAAKQFNNYLIKETE
jgi:NurA-like 5'-3' nuclease